MKAFVGTIKKSVSMFRRNKNTIKNLAFGLQKRYLGTKHNFGIRSIKYFGEKQNFGSSTIKYLRKEGIKKFKYIKPQTVNKGKKNIQMKRKELGSLINIVSKSKIQLPLIFFTGGLNKLTHFNLLPLDHDIEESSLSDGKQDKNLIKITNLNVKDTGAATNKGELLKKEIIPISVQTYLKDLFKNENVINNTEVVQLGGLTNINYLLTINTKPKTKLVQKFQANDLKYFVDRPEEQAIGGLISRKLIAPRILNVLENKYMLIEFAEGRVLDHKEIIDWVSGAQNVERQENLKLLLSTISEIHESKVDNLNKKPTIMRFIENYNEIKKDLYNLIEENEKVEDNKKYFLGLQDEMEDLVPKLITFLKDSVEEIEKNEGKSASIVLCHNDLCGENFIFDEKNKKLQLIDYEYSGQNYYYYEIANFLSMIESTYLDKEPFFTYDKLAQKKRDNFLYGFYQTHSNNLKAKNLNNNVNLSFDNYKKNVQNFTSLTHFFWIHLAIKTMYLGIEFNFRDYCKIKHDLIKEALILN